MVCSWQLVIYSSWLEVCSSWFKIKISMKRKSYYITIALILSFIIPAISFSETADHIVINEIQIADNEFVKLYNPTASEVHLDGWYFSYFSSARDWNNPVRNKQFPDGSLVKPNEYYVIGLKGFAIPTADWQPYTSAQLNNSNGSVAIFPWDPKEKTSAQAEEERVDAVAWGDISFVGEGTSLTANLKSDESAKRNNDGWDTDDNANDFEGVDEVEESEDEEGIVEDPTNLGNVYLSEIMPNPASPAKDSSDEWIELRNGSGVRIDLSGAILRDGIGSVHEYVIPNGTFIDPGRYIVFYSSATRISLNNSGDFVEFLDRDGSVLDSTGDDYGDAEDGYSYAFDGEGWRWTESPTPLGDNIIVEEVEEEDEDEEKIAASTSEKKKSKKSTKKKAKVVKKPKSKKGVKGTSSSRGDGLESDGDLGGENVLDNKMVGTSLIVIAILLGFNYIVFRGKLHEVLKQKN